MRISDWTSDVCSSDLIDCLLATKNRGLGRRLQHTDSIQRRLGRFVMRRSDRTTEPVHKGAVGLVLDLVAPTTGGMVDDVLRQNAGDGRRSEEHTSELQSLMRISYAVFCLQKNTETHIGTK